MEEFSQVRYIRSQFDTILNRYSELIGFQQESDSDSEPDSKSDVEYEPKSDTKPSVILDAAVQADTPEIQEERTALSLPLPRPRSREAQLVTDSLSSVLGTLISQDFNDFNTPNNPSQNFLVRSTMQHWYPTIEKWSPF